MFAIGNGPFRPAIKLYGQLWAAQAEFKTKQEAITEAGDMVLYLKSMVETQLRKAGYKPE